MSEPRTFLDGRVTLHAGDCREVLRGMADNSVDSVVTDPPYHLTSIVKRFGKSNLERDDANLQAPSNKRGGCTVSPYKRAAVGFMGKQWDGGDIAFQTELWTEVLRVLKPGAHGLGMGGTRTFHRLVCSIEDAGAEIRDCIVYTFGSGFPKSLNIGKKLDDWDGWGTALKPAIELICLFRKPISESSISKNVMKWGTGAINVGACRVGIDGGTLLSHQEPYGPDGRADQGGAQNWRTGHNVVELNDGRWPANLIHDGSDEVMECFPETTSGAFTNRKTAYRGDDGNKFSGVATDYDVNGCTGGDSGSAARFFYTAKADADDRLGSKHPTVKPLDLIQYLVRLVTPKNGVCLDLFAGTGTTGEACFREGFRAILVEREAEYIKDIERRMSLVMEGPVTRAHAGIKARGKPRDDGPLFGGDAEQQRFGNVAAGFEGEERRKRESAE